MAATSAERKARCGAALQPESSPFRKSKCAFCGRAFEQEHELLYGQRESSRRFSVHYFCMLLSTHLLQNGEDDQGIKGFLDVDIDKELRRARKDRCCYCHERGATVSCAKKSCRRIFHLPCGLERGAVPDFNTETFDAFCGGHAPQQDVQPLLKPDGSAECLVCLEPLEVALGRPVAEDLLVSPCCRQLYEKNCLRGYARCAGLHHFKCSHCRNSEDFLYTCRRHGIFVPDQDAEWERNDAFADHYVLHNVCDVPACVCPEGRSGVDGHVDWEVVRCDDCGKSGTHIRCSNLKDGPMSAYKCVDCGPIGSTSSSPTGSAQNGSGATQVTSAGSNSGGSRSSNLHYYLTSKQHTTFESEEVVVLCKEENSQGEDEEVDVEDSKQAVFDNKENATLVAELGGGSNQDTPASSSGTRGRSTSPALQSPSEDRRFCSKLSPHTPNRARHSAGTSPLSDSGSRKRSSLSTPRTPSKSPARPLRQLTLEGFTSPSRPAVPSNNKPVQGTPEQTKMDSPSSSKHLHPPSTPLKSMVVLQRSPSSRSVSSQTASPRRKRVRRKKLLKGQTTLNTFFKWVDIDQASSPSKSTTSMDSTPRKKTSIRDWFLGGPSTSTRDNEIGHTTTTVAGDAATKSYRKPNIIVKFEVRFSDESSCDEEDGKSIRKLSSE